MRGEAVAIEHKNWMYLIVGNCQQGCWHMAATLSAYCSNVAGSCRQPYRTVFKKEIIQVSKTIKITYSSFEVQELKKLKELSLPTVAEELRQ